MTDEETKLRDQIATAALNGMLVSHGYNSYATDEHFNAYASQAYRFADVMLKKRKIGL